MNKTIFFGLLFVFMILIQVFILNNILFLGYVNPYLYIMFIFLYPLNKNRFVFLFLAFLLGLIIDFFSDSGGIHAFSTLFIAYIRLFFVRVYFNKFEVDFPFFRLNLEPFGKRFNYVVTLTVIHHFILFSFANFSFQNFSNVIINTIYSSIFTLIIYFLATFIFSKKQ
ncbi:MULTISPECIES: rod shape-determining protein MreD [Polaribacter]|uniref:Rod shape-determining protein MreD n=1 Tax=Polaribacter marinaquae TaxID=1642819 RepID=A0ABZ2TPN3_9FLAO|nr:rod shape-determining protein MreD [Polaribacter sp. KT 15]SHM84574.1 rod shape-determining protein MreD [Polaribacter sp. KT 15]